MPEYNEALYKYFNYCLDSITNEYAKCEFVMRMNKLIALMPDEADKNAIIRFTQDYFIPRDEKEIKYPLINIRKGAMQSLIYGYAAAWENHNDNERIYLRDYADLSDCNALVMNSIFGPNKDYTYIQDMGIANYDSLLGSNPTSYKIEDKKGNTVDLSARPKPKTITAMNERAQKLPKGIKSRDESLMSTFSACPPVEPLFSQKELLAVEVKLQQMQKAINPNNDFSYKNSYENEKLNILKELNSIKLFTEQAKNTFFDLKAIEDPHSAHLEYRRKEYEREKKEYEQMEADILRSYNEYQAEEKLPMPKNVKKLINTPKKMKNKLLQSQIKRLTAKRKRFQKATVEFTKRNQKIESPSKTEENFRKGYSELQSLMASCFDENNRFKRKDISLSELREKVKDAYKALDYYTSHTSSWNPKNWAGENRAKLSAAKRAKKRLNAILACFENLKDKGVKCRYYTLMSDGSILSNRENTKDIDNNPKAAKNPEHDTNMSDTINTDSKDNVNVKSETDKTIETKKEIDNKVTDKTTDKKETEKKDNVVITEGQDKKELTKNEVKNEPVKPEVKKEVKAPKTVTTENIKQKAMVAPQKATSKDPFAALVGNAKYKEMDRNRDIEFLSDYRNKVAKYSGKIPNFEKQLNSNDINVLNALKNNTSLKSDTTKRYLEHRINKLNEFNKAVTKAVENMQNRKVEELKITAENNENLFNVDNVVQSEMQHTRNGCWSVALSTLLKHRGVNLDQSVIRAYRPDKQAFLDDTLLANIDTANQIISYTGLIQAVLPNTSVNEASYSIQADNKLWTDKEQQKEISNVIPKMKETIEYALKEANGPVAILIGRHYRTIYGFKKGLFSDTVYLNDPMKENPESVSLSDLAKESILDNTTTRGGKTIHSNSCTFSITWLKDLQNELGEVQYTENMKKCGASYDKQGKLSVQKNFIDYKQYKSLLVDDPVIKDIGMSVFLPNKLIDIQLKKEKKQVEGNVSKAKIEPNVKNNQNVNIEQNASNIKTENLEKKSDDIKEENTESKLNRSLTRNEDKVKVTYGELNRQKLSETPKRKNTLTKVDTTKKIIKTTKASNKKSIEK